MSEAWLLTLTPATREWVETFPEDVRDHPWLRVLLADPGEWLIIDDRTRARLIAEVREVRSAAARAGSWSPPRERLGLLQPIGLVQLTPADRARIFSPEENARAAFRYFKSLGGGKRLPGMLGFLGTLPTDHGGRDDADHEEVREVR